MTARSTRSPASRGRGGGWFRTAADVALVAVTSWAAVIVVVLGLAVMGVPGAIGVVRVGAPPPGLEERPVPLSTPAATALLHVPDDAFLVRDPEDGVAVRWSPCRPVHYVVHDPACCAGASDLLAQAFDDVADATGLVFVLDGVTDEVPSPQREDYQPHRYGDRWAPVLVAWADVTEWPDLRGTALGFAGPQAVESRPASTVFVTGQVVLDAGALGGMLARHDRTAALAVVRHEVGHLAGLADRHDSRSLMSGQLLPSVTSFTDTDRAALATLGRGPCAPTV